jgi:hypothetical protein
MFPVFSSRSLVDCEYAPVEQDPSDLSVEDTRLASDVPTELDVHHVAARSRFTSLFWGRGVTCAELRVLGSAIFGVSAVVVIAGLRKAVELHPTKVTHDPDALVSFAEDVVRSGHAPSGGNHVQSERGNEKIVWLNTTTTHVRLNATTTTTNLPGLLPPLHCKNYICTDGYEAKPDALEYCEGHTCTRDDCCAPLGQCSDFPVDSCESGKKKIISSFLFYPVFCADMECSEAECCILKHKAGECAEQFPWGTCAKAMNDENWESKKDGWCRGEQCQKEECCESVGAERTVCKIAAACIGVSTAVSHMSNAGARGSGGMRAQAGNNADPSGHHHGHHGGGTGHDGGDAGDDGGERSKKKKKKLNRRLLELTSLHTSTIRNIRNCQTMKSEPLS